MVLETYNISNLSVRFYIVKLEKKKSVSYSVTAIKCTIMNHHAMEGYRSRMAKLGKHKVGIIS